MGGQQLEKREIFKVIPCTIHAKGGRINQQVAVSKMLTDIGKAAMRRIDLLRYFFAFCGVRLTIAILRAPFSTASHANSFVTVPAPINTMFAPV